MQEETTQKTIALVMRSSKLTADVLKKAIRIYLEHRKAGKRITHGKISVKELMGKDMGASSIEISDKNIKSFERVAKKYNLLNSYFLLQYPIQPLSYLLSSVCCIHMYNLY